MTNEKAISELSGNATDLPTYREALAVAIRSVKQIDKIKDLVEGTIDHFDREDAIDLLYEIKVVIEYGGLI